MDYPTQVIRTYVNPYGNVIASGLYRSYLTQDLANDFPFWMHLRQNPRSVGQQFIATTAINLEKAEKDLEYNAKSKFLKTAPVDEVDVVYRSKLPSNLNLLDASASGVRCIAAPSGCSPSGVSQIWLIESNSLEDFYYNIVPSRLEIMASGDFNGTLNEVEWNIRPSGLLDRDSKKIDVWKKQHDITWCCSDGYFRKQDIETMEDYETYIVNPGYGTLTDMFFKDGFLWWIGKDGSTYYINMTSTKTQEPVAVTLDLIVSFNVTGQFNGLEPSGIIIDDYGALFVCDTNKTRTFEIHPRYDYFTLDKTSRYVYFREDYRNSGVFISNT